MPVISDYWFYPVEGRDDLLLHKEIERLPPLTVLNAHQLGRFAYQLGLYHRRCQNGRGSSPVPDIAKKLEPTFLRAALSVLPTANDWDTGNIFWGWTATDCIFSPSFLDTFFEAMHRGHQWLSFTPRNAAGLLEGLARSKASIPSDFLESLLETLTKEMGTDQSSIKNASPILSSLAAMHCTLPPAFCETIYNVLEKNDLLNGLFPQKLRNIAWSMATMRIPPAPSFWPRFEAAFLCGNKIDDSSTKDIVITLWSLATLSVCPSPAFMEALRDKADLGTRLRGQKAHHTGLILWALAVFSALRPLGKAEKDIINAVTHVWREEGAAQNDPKANSMAALAFVRLFPEEKESPTSPPRLRQHRFPIRTEILRPAGRHRFVTAERYRGYASPKLNRRWGLQNRKSDNPCRI